MKRTFVILYLLIVSCQLSLAQKEGKLWYSKNFNSYYTEGPLKLEVNPGISMMMGDAKGGISPSFGVSANYQVNAPIHAVVGLRYLGLSSEASSSTFYQLNLLGRYYIHYDRVKTNKDRRRKPRFWKLYLGTGLSISKYSAVSDEGSTGGYRFNTPLLLGIPLRIDHQWTIIPEASFYYTLTEKIDALDHGGPKDRFVVIGISIQYSPWSVSKKTNMRKRGRAIENEEENENATAPNDNKKLKPSDDTNSTTEEEDESSDEFEEDTP